MNLPEKSDRELIKGYIERYFAQFKTGETLKSENIVKHVHTYYNRKIFDGTILRYTRLLRSEGKISYRCLNKRDRVIELT